MVGRNTTNKNAPSYLFDASQEQYLTPPLQPLPNTSPTPTRVNVGEMSTPLGSLSERMTSALDQTQVDALIKRYLDNGQFKTAMFWADKRLVLSRKKDRPLSLVDVAEFIKVLSAVGDHTRLIEYSQKHELVLKHLVFAYFYVNALFEKKYFATILKLELSSLKGFNFPTEPVVPFMAYLYKTKSFLPSEEESRILDKMSSDLKLEAALLILLGKTYLMTQNRQSARLCLQSALKKDCCAVEAMEIIHKYDLLPKRNFDEIIDRFPYGECGIPNALVHFPIMDGRKEIKNKLESSDHPTLKALNDDLYVRTAKAIHLYRTGDVRQANKITTQILEDAGMFQDCILVHVATLVHLRKSDELFMLSHKLVDNQPDHEFTWYAVGCYYYVIGQFGAAKNFLNKCITMNSSFGEGWLAFGHVLSAESEHEQAMNCYLRASRVLEGSFEPLMYIGLQYSYANNTKLALDFLNDAAISSGENALVLHEQGCIHYMMKQWESAEEHFTRALKLAYGLTDADEVCDIMELLWKPISQFWEPLLNNLGHTKRKLGKYLDAVKFHQKAIVLRPQKASTIGAMAVAFASAGRVDEAAIQFHNALSLSPHDQVLMHGLEKLMECFEANACLSSIQLTESSISKPISDMHKMPQLSADDLSAKGDEVEVQQKALETLRRYKTRRRHNIPTLRSRNAHSNRQQTTIIEGTVTEMNDDADIEMTAN